MSIIPWWCGFWPIKIDISAQALMTGRYTCLFTLWLADLPAFSILWLADSPACSPCHWLIHLPIHTWLADLPADSSLNLDHWHCCRQFHPVSSNHTVSSPDVCVLSVLHGVSVPASAYAPPAPPWLHRLPLAARVWHYGPRLPVSHGNHPQRSSEFRFYRASCCVIPKWPPESVSTPQGCWKGGGACPGTNQSDSLKPSFKVDLTYEKTILIWPPQWPLLTPVWPLTPAPVKQVRLAEAPVPWPTTYDL